MLPVYKIRVFSLKPMIVKPMHRVVTRRHCIGGSTSSSTKFLISPQLTFSIITNKILHLTSSWSPVSYFYTDEDKDNTYNNHIQKFVYNCQDYISRGEDIDNYCDSMPA